MFFFLQILPNLSIQTLSDFGTRGPIVSDFEVYSCLCCFTYFLVII